MKTQPINIGMRPSHPGSFICEEVFEELAITEIKGAEIVGVSSDFLSEFLHNKTSITPELAMRIEKAFGISMELLLKMQAQYDSYIMRQRESEFHIERYRTV